jgi:plasmid stabilization system protein ParE
LKRVEWTGKALSDLQRLHEFMGYANQGAAARAVKALTAAAGGLAANPRIGEQLAEFAPGDVRRLLVGQYDMRYEVFESRVVVRLWHTREER